MEVVVIALVLLVLFGGKKLNELARGLGESSKEIKKLKEEIDKTKEEIKSEIPH